MKTEHGLILGIMALLISCGCVQPDAKNTYCTSKETGKKMSLADARDMAARSYGCTNAGRLKEDAYCDPTGAWLLDIDTGNDKCSIKCRIDVSTGSDGIQSDCAADVTSFQECVAAGYAIEKTAPARCKTPDGRVFVEELIGPFNPEGPLGGQRDEHGCLGPAGYAWDADVGACTRSWELTDYQKKAAKTAVAPLSFYVTVVTVDMLECDGCYDVRLQRNDNQEHMTVTLKDWKVAGSASQMTYDEALATAKDSECAKEGGFTAEQVYNEGTRTWWISMDIKKEGCNPACVVSEDTKTAEINWRCTGIITPEGTKNLIADASNNLAFDLYAKYYTKEGNVFYSPYSIISALAMTSEGARGDTLSEMQKVLYLPADDALRQGEFSALNAIINKKEKDYKLSVANALWAQTGYPFLSDYFDLVAKYYGGKTTNLDIAKDPEGSRQTINKWVEDNTNGKIKDLIPQGILGPMTPLVLTNAIYFKGSWVKQFDPKETQDADFTVAPGNTVKVKMMHASDEDYPFSYAEEGGVQVLEIPYTGNELSMIVLLPKEGEMDKLESSLTAEKLPTLTGPLSRMEVNVYLPRFKFDTEYMMAKDLQEMGMKKAFGNLADFSGMTGKKDLFIGEVIHKAYVEVNEEGTEAAAATAVIMEGLAIGPGYEPPTFRADHPFIFLIKEKSTGSILFMGRVTDPTR